MLADWWLALSARSVQRAGGTRGAGHPPPTSVSTVPLRGEDVSLRAATRIVRAATLNSDSVKKCVVTENVYRIAVHYQTDAVIWIAILGLQWFWIWIPLFKLSTKLGMHKMELGDSVYAAERIIRKRIRKVSFISLQNIAVTDSNLAKHACEITYQRRSIGDFICKLLVSQHANAWLFCLHRISKHALITLYIKCMAAHDCSTFCLLIPVLWRDGSCSEIIARVLCSFSRVFFYSYYYQESPYICVRRLGASVRNWILLYKRCPSRDYIKFLTVNKFGRDVWGVTLRYCNMPFLIIFLEPFPVTNLILILITINTAFWFWFFICNCTLGHMGIHCQSSIV